MRFNLIVSQRKCNENKIALSSSHGKGGKCAAGVVQVARKAVKTLEEIRELG